MINLPKIFKDQSKIIYFFSPGMCCGLRRTQVCADAAEILKSCGSMLFIINPVVFKDTIVSERKMFLKNLAKETGGRYYDGKKEEIAQEITKVNRSYYEIAFPDDPGEESGTHSIFIKSKIAGITLNSIRKVSRGKSYEEMDNIEIIGILTKIKGIGTWSAEMFLIFCLNRLDVLPLDDVGFKKSLIKSYSLEAVPEKEEILKISKKWGQYKSIAVWYLWQSLNRAEKQST